MSTRKIRVLLVDDHPLVTAGVRHMLGTADDMIVVAQAQGAHAAMIELATCSIDVALVDIDLPDENGLTLLERMKRVMPHVAVLVLSGYGEDIYALRALRAGADGYLSKGAPLEDVVSAVRKVADGGKHFSEFFSELLFRQVQGKGGKPHAVLTGREFEIMMRLVAGDSTSAIAAHLNRSPKTISTHRSRLFEKLKIHSNAQLARYAMEQGLISSAPANKRTNDTWEDNNGV